MAGGLQPAILGGLFIGVLSALPYVNACCCIWVIAGGVLATYLTQERVSSPVTAGDGAIGGLAAGAVGAVLAWALGLGFALLQGTAGPQGLDALPRADMPPEFGRILDQIAQMPAAVFYIAPLILFLIVFPVFGLLGGLLGVPMFRRTPPPPPPGTVEVLPPQI